MRATTDKGAVSLFARRIVLADREVAGTIVVENGDIVAVEEDRQRPEAIDCGDDLIIPGLVELHTDHLEPHYAPRPKVYWNPLSAVFAYDAQIAASGITTVFDSLRVGRDDDRPGVSDALLELSEGLEEAKRSGLLRADHHTHLRCEIPSRGVVEEASDYLARFDVRLMSLMDHTPGQRQFRDEEKQRVYYRGKSGLAEDELTALFEARKARSAIIAEPNKRGLVALAHDRGIALASHDDTLEEHVTESLADRVSIAEFPTTVEAARASHAAGIAVLMGAPNVVRGGSHSGNVSALELAEAGVLDILSSDYVPISLIQGAFGLAGVPAVGGLPGAIRTVSKAPAEATGMTDRGEIAVGKRGDLVRVVLVGSQPVVRQVWRTGLRIS
ncbi:alpha-D-ribose 1-methylphosphonate 5-triphosphate diphosphatase [Phreatobacter sp. AB_2022a]|uniref:alpha-D-ribose 1-methylphosphonate 5-triphosphate diphosphatase n=1 Tax=Phreatobacter sp. AB_2022a TaxID=3003134 RepID=UPI000570760A|nr:alpha-D-ribose 1-methylphosphonate 5-triphosphate diphosphatase [Phreatobacter sp. AB_2022a]MCZ0734502.1 alpha-D-ribose 1-methylphosphonate 5-triphosphate diphosphatase [Phreatobacter sp. AB_2022a]CEJ14694.1 Alpha-D-ribose 1-methylphosphonate 5-triphosphate diphosphatase [bacterium YEK0313]